jgi:hypothetical protein
MVAATRVAGAAAAARARPRRPAAGGPVAFRTETEAIGTEPDLTCQCRCGRLLLLLEQLGQLFDALAVRWPPGGRRRIGPSPRIGGR